jgi:electron transport complex protein RnfD
MVTTAHSLQGIMWRTNAALVPGIVCTLAFYSSGYLWNIGLALALGVSLEAAALRLRGIAVVAALSDGTATLTCLLIALACPPGASPYVILIACTVALPIAKHLYGGLGHNLFNPAMAGYASALVCFPAEFTQWPIPTDGTTAATALDSLKTLQGQTMFDRVQPINGFGTYGGYAVEWLAVAFAVGGAYLMWQRIIAWRVVGGFLIMLIVCAALGYDNGSSASGGSPAMHLLSGGTLLAAFFVLTDPVTHPGRPRGQWLFGIMVAIIVYAVRRFGAYPDGIAFAVLLANAVTPLLDRLVTPDLPEAT